MPTNLKLNSLGNVHRSFSGTSASHHVRHGIWVAKKLSFFFCVCGPRFLINWLVHDYTNKVQGLGVLGS